MIAVKSRIFALMIGVALVPSLFAMPVRAHCPLCSAGAGGAAAAASALGVGLAVVGLFVGAFGIATGFWTARYIEDDYVPYQTLIVVVGVYLAFVVPMYPFMTETTPLFVPITGEYGTMLNRIYLMNTFLIGSIVGAIVTASTPRISDLITTVRGSTVPYQGMALTFVLLGASAGFVELLM